ncbi:DUF4328 domain-containing protein [Flavobacterium sp. GNP001]
MEILRPNKQRAKNAITLIWIALAVEVISLISGFVQFELIAIAINGGGISPEAANANDLREQVIAVINLIVLLTSAVTFIQWFRRAYYNLHLRAEELSFTEGWAAGSWFVPIINLSRPYQIMKELYNETHVLIEKNGLNTPANFTVNHIGWWWGLWIVNSIFGQFVFRYSNDAVSLDELSNATIISMVGHVLGIPLAIIAIKVIKDYSILERQLFKISATTETPNLEANFSNGLT